MFIVTPFSSIFYDLSILCQFVAEGLSFNTFFTDAG